MINVHHSPYVHDSSSHRVSKTIDDFFGPVHLIRNWITSGGNQSVYDVVHYTTIEQEEEEALKYLELKRVEKEQVRRSTLEKEEEIQSSLVKSLSMRLTVFVTVVIIALSAFLLVLAVTFGVSYLIQEGISGLDSIVQTKIAKGLRYIQFFVCGVDSILLCIFLFKTILVTVIKGKVLN